MREPASSVTENKIRHIYWFAYYGTDSPSVRYRAQYPLEFFHKKYRLRYHLVIPGYTPFRIMAFLRAWTLALCFRKPGSLIVIQRVQSRFLYATLLKLLVRAQNKNTVYDLDDADYLEKDPQTIYYFAKNCAGIAAGSRAIASHLDSINHNIVLTTSPVVELGISKSNRSNPFTIGWIGSFGGGHQQGLEEVVFPALKKLDFPFRLTLLGVRHAGDALKIRNYFSGSGFMELEIPLDIDWNDETGIQKRITRFDIGIATLTHDPMQLAKSGIKAKQYLNNGVPVLSTRLPENNAVVTEGINGYFCDTPDAYEARIREFHSMNDETYFRFSEQARKSAVYFNHDHYYSCLNRLAH